jgi:plastocyanin
MYLYNERNHAYLWAPDPYAGHQIARLAFEARYSRARQHILSNRDHGHAMPHAAPRAAAIFLQLGVVGARAEELKITIDNFTFTPPELKVKVGDTVTWTNHDDIPHTVVSAGKFRSKTLDSDDSFSFTFTAAGDYKYFCGIHPHMTGLIKVE